MQYSHSLHESQNIFVTISVLSIVNSLLLYRQWWIEFFYQHCFTYFHLFSLNFFKTFIFIFITYLCLPQECKSPFRTLNLNFKNNMLWSRWHKLCVDKTHCWGKMRKRDEIDKTSPIITRECCSSSLSRNSHPKVRIIFEKKKTLWYLILFLRHNSMVTSELVTYFSQSLLSITVSIQEVLKVEGSDQCEDGPFFFQ